MWDPTARLWMKTPPEPTLFELSVPFSEIWPASGSMRNGTCSVHPTSGPRTSVRAFSSSPGLLPTPTTSEGNGPGAPDGNRNDTLRARVRQLPTPRARDGKGVGFEDGLPAVVQLLKTPTAQLAVNGGSQHPHKRKRGGHGPTLADEVEHLLPTPTVADSRDTRNRRPDGTPYGQGYGETLTDAAALLPTPRASDGTKASPGQKHGDGTPSLAGAAASIGAPTPTPSRAGKRSRSAPHPGQLTIEAA